MQQNNQFSHEFNLPVTGQQAGLNLPIQGQQAGLNQGLLGQGLSGQLGSLGQGQQIGLDQGLLGQGIPLQGQSLGFNQGIPLQGQSLGFNQGISGQGIPLQGQSLGFNQGIPLQGQSLGFSQGISGQGIPLQGQSLGFNQGISGQGIPLQGQSLGFNQGISGQGQSLEDLARQAVLGQAGANFQGGSNLSSDLSKLNLGQPGFTNSSDLNSQGFMQSGLSSTNFTNNLGSQGLIQPGFNNDIGMGTGNSFGNTTGMQGQNQEGLISGTGNNFATGMDKQTLNQTERIPSAGIDSTIKNSGLTTDAGESFGGSLPITTDVEAPIQAEPISDIGANIGTSDAMLTSKADLPIETNVQSLPQPVVNEAISDTSSDSSVDQDFAATGDSTHQLPESSKTANLIVGSGLDKQIDPANTEKVFLATEASGSTTNSRGTFVFRPLEGKFNTDKDPVGKMDPYCKIKIGFHGGKTSVAKNEGIHPVWNDVITIERKHNEQFAKIRVKDNDKITFNDNIGNAKIPLDEIALKGKVNQWYPIYKKDKITGEILLDIDFQPNDVNI